MKETLLCCFQGGQNFFHLVTKFKHQNESVKWSPVNQSQSILSGYFNVFYLM